MLTWLASIILPEGLGNLYHPEKLTKVESALPKNNNRANLIEEKEFFPGSGQVNQLPRRGPRVNPWLP
jgi:hypothetical protein